MWLPPLFHATLGSALSAPASSHFRTNTEKGRGGACWGWEFAFPLCFFVMVCAVVCVSSVAPRPSLPPYCGCGVSCVGIKIEALIGSELISFRASLHPY